MGEKDVVKTVKKAFTEYAAYVLNGFLFPVLGDQQACKLKCSSRPRIPDRKPAQPLQHEK
jgi:hypothetical protein